jgi:hypothetical protein
MIRLRSVSLYAVPVFLATLGFAPLARADVPPPDECTGSVGATCSNAGPSNDQDGICTNETCTHSTPNGDGGVTTSTYACVLCELSDCGSMPVGETCQKPSGECEEQVCTDKKWGCPEGDTAVPVVPGSCKGATDAGPVHDASPERDATTHEDGGSTTLNGSSGCSAAPLEAGNGSTCLFGFSALGFVVAAVTRRRRRS